MKLRDYQEASVASLLDYWSGGGGHGLIVLPTGAGKSLVAAELMYRLWRDYGARPLLVTHVSELIAQNASKLAEIHPDAPHGIYSAGLKRRDGDAPICFAGIQSIHRKPEVVGKREVIMVDEAHLLSHRDEGMYRKFIGYMDKQVKGMRVGGLTATPFRLSSGRLDEAYGEHEALFDSIVYEEPITKLIEEGHLLPIVPYISPTRVDMQGAKLSGGDYNQKDLQERFDRDDINLRVVKEIYEAGRERETWLVFASGVDHARHLTEIFRAAGVVTECVTGETPDAEKRTIYDKARAGKVKCLVGVNVLTTGLDIPNIDLIACVRPTKSLGLWVQLLGRGTRLSPDTGKQDTLLLDFTDNSLELGPIDQASGSKTKGKVTSAPMRACPACNYVHHISLKRCPECLHEYPPDDIKYTSQNRAKAVLSQQLEPVWLDVDKMAFKRHVPWDAEKVPSFRIDYVCGLTTVSRWLAFDTPKGKVMAQRWWKNNSLSGEPPETVAEALERTSDIRTPGRVQVMKKGKYNTIVAMDYSVEAMEV